MIDFIFGAFFGGFIMVVLLQLATKKTINLAGVTDKSENSERYWNFVFSYLVGSPGIFVLFLIYKL